MAASPRLDLPGSSLEAEFGGTGGGVRESPIAAAVGASASAPPKATAAPTGTTKYTYTGLCDALNAYEQSLVKAGTVEYANQYVIEFAPASLASSGIVLPGTSDKKMAPGQQTDTAKNKVLPETNTFNSKGKNIAVSQGTQIIQFIELTMRNSRYITDQLLVTQDQVTGNSIPSTSITTNKKLLVVAKAETGPAGPTARAFYMQVSPNVFKKLPKNPIVNKYKQNVFLFIQ